MILVTGGTGLVGSHLLLELCKTNNKVRAIYRARSNRELVKQIFSYYTSDFENLYSRIEWVEADINDVLALEDAFKGVEYVYHCAALVSFNKRHRDKLWKVNIEGTANIVNACLDAGVKKLCYVSSTAALGKGEEHKLLTEKDSWEKTPDVSNYSISKHLAEQEVWRGTEEGLNAVMVNPSVIIGPHNWDNSSTALFKTIYNGLSFYTPGSNAVVDVRVVVKAMIELMQSELKAERYLVITENISFKHLCETIAQSFGKKGPQKKAGKFLVNLARLMEALKCRFTGKEPRITKETVQAAFKHFSYDCSKLKKALPDLETGTAQEAVENAAGFFKQHYNLH